MQKINNGLFIFHRDFRIRDNRGLIEASKQCKNLFTCFIFTPSQISKVNSYRSNNSIQFMMESLEELQTDIRQSGGELLFFYGKETAVLEKIIPDLEIEAVFKNKDYTPYALKRDSMTDKLCEKMKLPFASFQDYYLYEPGTIRSGTGSNASAYKKYTPFYTNVIGIPVEKPVSHAFHGFKKGHSRGPISVSLDQMKHKFCKENPDILVHGGRTLALLQLKKACQEQKKYDETRDFFTNNTTFLSAYIKFGCVSIREVYHAIKKQFGLHHGILRELIWREFFAHVLFAYPEVVGQSYQTKYRGIKWHESSIALKRWKDGKTGFPIVDACMRQLNQTGYMHNRGRMTVASFLIKTLLMDWRLGEAYFAQRLTDYDLASNNGNWQGISGTGVDMKPYFRDMNPWIQQRKYDVDAEFIKKWVPELAEVDTRDIHRWNISCEDPNYQKVNYPKPMVDYDEQKPKMLHMYKAATS
jgi:deoxyribodipyrimidine photo-lyase